MPLFGETYGLKQLILLMIKTLNCSEIYAQEVLFQKLRRGEISAYCEWAYAAEPHGALLTTHKLSPEPWIIASKIDTEADEIEVKSPQARDIRFASAIYFKASDIDFLDAVYKPEEIAQELPKRGRRPGTGLEKLDAPYVDQIVAMVRSGEASSTQAAARIVVGDGSGVPGGATVDNKIDRLRRRASEIIERGE